ncbi:MAG: hypothetical protein U9O78_01900 [Patescibacteria group bacterium]|nr:hypothetical protein [Patescibacteria group bacterium]
MPRLKKNYLYLLILSLFLAVGWCFLKPASLVIAEEDCSKYNCESLGVDSEDFNSCEKDKNKCEELKNEIKDLEKKIDQKQGEAQTLENAISVINGEVRLQQLQISQTLNEIGQLTREIGDLANRIDGLSLSLDKLTDMLIARIQQSYKQQRTTPLIALFTTESFKKIISQYKYLHQAEIQTASAMEQAENQRLAYDQQKDLKEVKQTALEEKQQELQTQKAALEIKKASKQKLLNETNDDEATYQKLLYEAKTELDSLSNYVNSQVGSETCLASSPTQPDGWYYSQRDPRWCRQHIGVSSMSIGEVGCLITSVAMIWQKHGHSTTPAIIGANPNYFSAARGLEAYMKRPFPTPLGYTSRRYYSYNQSIIDQEINAGRPVIVHVAFGRDGHWVVLKEGNGGNYIMNDPLEGSNIPFGNKFGTYQIDTTVTFTP